MWAGSVVGARAAFAKRRNDTAHSCLHLAPNVVWRR